ncbi:MAG: hypothetical protein ABSA67_08095 [Candidatus Brocadiia bacterium]
MQIIQEAANSRRQSVLITLALLFAAGLCAGSALAQNPKALSVTPASPRAGFMFSDSEPIDMQAKATGLTGPACLQYRLTDSEGTLVQQGEVPIAEFADGAGEVRLPLEIRGRRGLYPLWLNLVCGERKATAATSVAVVFTPDPPDEASPWGIFYIPLDDRPLEQAAADLALSQRLLGASWVRFNFWAETFGKVTITPGAPPSVDADWSRAKAMVRALRKQGLYVMGEVAQCPRELSSRPNDTAVIGDAGPVYNRVKPADYALWDQLMTKLSADFREDIKVWEIWNEPNLTNRYWTGTVDDFAELVHHTAAALRRGNSEAHIAGPGLTGFFDSGQTFADRLFQLGVGKDLDILTVHYTDDIPSAIDGWQALLKQHHLQLPLWNSEERSEIPLRNLASPIERSFKFLHVFAGYADYRPLVNRDLTARPAGLAYSVGAHCLGLAKHTGSSSAIPGYETHFFQRGEEAIADFDNRGNLFCIQATATLAVQPLQAGRPVTLTDLLGRSTEVQIKDGQATINLKDTCLLNGARSLKILRGAAGGPSAGMVVAQAAAGRLGPGWQVTPHENFSEGRTADIWTKDEPGPEGYWVEVTLTVPADGSYEVLFSGNSLMRLKPPRSLSPFVWQIDGGAEHAVEKAPPAVTSITGATEGLATLDKVELKAGAHTFRLKLTARRDQPDHNYALWFHALALRLWKPPLNQ